jgi:uncharacterized membrane protein
MTDKSTDAQDQGLGEPQPFRAVLTPHRSLTPRGFLIVMGLLGLVSFVTGMAFLLAGAWPVLGFFGLDVLIVYVAFRLNYRSGRLCETLEVTRETLELVRIHPSGRRESHRFNPHWVRVVLEEARDGRTQLRLGSHGREVGFARFLTDGERREVADALKSALVTARGGPRI